MKNISYHLMQLALYILLLIGLNSCLYQIKTPIIEPVESFYGLEDLIQLDSQANGGNSGSAVLIATHGMCYHDIIWAQSTLDRFASLMGMDVINPLRPLGDPGPDAHFGASGYRADLSDSVGSRNLTLYTVLYADVAKQAKQTLCYDSSVNSQLCPDAEGQYPYPRASLNADLKSGLLNDCFSDAVYYLGDGGDRVLTGFQGVLDEVLANLGDDPRIVNSPVAFLSESLGSKIMTDAIVSGASATVESRLSRLRNTSLIFLGANQIPLLNLGQAEPGCKPDVSEIRSGLPRAYENEWLNILSNSQIRMSREGFAIPKALVAFNDPNDLLSYPVREDCDVANGIQVINVMVSNTKTLFGLVENPLPAHTGYRENNDVLAIIRSGYEP